MLDATTPELAPCPFCGGKATLRDDGFADPTWIVFCIDCRIGTDFQRDRAVAIARWNRRVPHPDAQRLDLIERHRLALAPSMSAPRWVVAEHDSAGVSTHGPTVREAIDAAGRAIESKEPAEKPRKD